MGVIRMVTVIGCGRDSHGAICEPIHLAMRTLEDIDGVKVSPVAIQRIVLENEPDCRKHRVYRCSTRVSFDYSLHRWHGDVFASASIRDAYIFAHPFSR